MSNFNHHINWGDTTGTNVNGYISETSIQQQVSVVETSTFSAATTQQRLLHNFPIFKFNHRLVINALVSSALAAASDLTTTTHSITSPTSFATTSSPQAPLLGNSSTLSTGAKAGVSVVCAIAAIGIVLLAVTLALMRHHRKEMPLFVYYEREAIDGNGNEHGILPRETGPLAPVNSTEAGSRNPDVNRGLTGRQVHDLAAY
jgi:hypothetical protein